MSILKLYRYKHLIVIPTIATTAEGLLVESIPVQICDVDDPALPSVIEDCLLHTPELEDQDEADQSGPKSVVVEALKLKKWRDLEQNALLYMVHRSSSAVEVHVTGRGDDGFWKRDDSLRLSYPQDESTGSLAQKLAKVMKERKPLEEKPIRLLGGPAPALPPPSEPTL